MVTNGFLTSPGEIPARTRAAPEPSTSLEASLKKGEKRVRIRPISGKGLIYIVGKMPNKRRKLVKEKKHKICPKNYNKKGRKIMDYCHLITLKVIDLYSPC